VEPDGRVLNSRDASPDEWHALDTAVGRGLVDLECHGFTHLDPDLAAWCDAPDKHDNSAWYREFWPERLAEEPSVEAQSAILAQWQRHCGRGTAVVAPGERWWVNTIVAARERGFELFNSWEVCRLQLQRPVWSTGIGAPYLDRPDTRHFENQLPTVLYWHDRDMALGGPDWAPRHLDAWRECGARRAIAFADLVNLYTDFSAVYDGRTVALDSPKGVPMRVTYRGDADV
jgi:hypothetical protein